MKTRTFAILGALAVSVAAVAAACGDESLPSDTTSSSTTTGDSTTTSSGTTTSSTTSGMGGGGTGGGGTGGAPDCYMNPMTHVEIINACTDAQQIDINPVLPLLEADGGLPPLP